MKLVLANNQTERFVDFYAELQRQEPGVFEYASYDKLLFIFDIDATNPITVHHMGTGKQLSEYDGVYLNGFLDTYELAATTATCCQALNIPFVNKELADAPSLSKLTSYAKLLRNNVRIPRTVSGAKRAITEGMEYVETLHFPLVLKRADADRGIDNFKVTSSQEITDLLAEHDDRSIWIVQEFVPNDGFYLVSFYDQTAQFSIFRSLQEREDGNAQKAHMYKPKGGANASQIAITDLPPEILETANQAMLATNRQIGSVDILFDPKTKRAFVLEVNYNPQLVTIETLKEIRVSAFIEGISRIH